MNSGANSSVSPYIGRFAPSPTGPLHFGSLLAACASYLEAMRHHGQWLVRIEDIDPPREQVGASQAILDALDAYQFDGAISYQSDSADYHREAIARLTESDLAYACRCSRKDLADAPDGPLGKIYPGTCRDLAVTGESALRVRIEGAEICFDDQLQGRQCQDMARESGDFVIRRRDQLVAYHLAVVVDDHLQGITHIVRGIDLMDSTARQIWLQNLLGYTSPAYTHIPVAVHANGDKLSKLTGAPGLDLKNPAPELFNALLIMRQNPPESLRSATIDRIWEWAREYWDISRMRGQQALSAHGRQIRS